MSIKNKNKVVTKNINISKTKNGVSKKVQLTPRGQLHKETVYGVSKQIQKKATKLSKRFTIAQANMIANQHQRNLVLAHLAQFNDDATIAFDGKTLKKYPIIYKKEPLKEVVCFEEIYTIRKPISPELKIDKIVDEKIKTILKERLATYENNPKVAFSNLKENPIWLNKAKGIAVKRVAIKGVSNAIPLHSKKNNFGKEIINKKEKKQAVDFISTGNNHHIAIYKDAEGNLQDNIISFYEAVERVNQGLPIIDKNYKKEHGWKFLFTMKQNEMFVFSAQDFNPFEIDLLNESNASNISKHLFRVQTISKVLAGNSYVRDFMFRHHLETEVKKESLLKGVTYKQFKSLKGLDTIVKVRLNHIGKIVQVGEY